jgi:hypothetical protein
VRREWVVAGVVILTLGVWLGLRNRGGDSSSSPSKRSGLAPEAGETGAGAGRPRPAGHRTLQPQRLRELQRLAIGLAQTSGNARADESMDEMRQRFDDGVKAYEAGQWDLAAALFLEGYDVKAKPNLLFNAAVCFEKMKDACHAAELFERYLDELPEANDIDTVVARIAQNQAGCVAQRK